MDDDFVETREMLSLRVAREGKNYMFDIEIRNESEEETLILLAPNRIKHEKMGCVVIIIDPSDRNITSANIFTLVHDHLCSAPGTPPLEKKYGTRAMLLGSLYCVVHLSRTKWPWLTRFFLQDEGTYNCPPLDMKVLTTASDYLVKDDMYYERHIGVHPDLKKVLNAKHRVLRLVKQDIAMNFKAFWETLVTSQRAFTLDEKQEWLDDNRLVIKDIYNKESTITWRDLFIALQDEFGCSFFACTLMRLKEMFKMSPLIGAGWVVDFEELPGVDDAIVEYYDGDIMQVQLGGQQDNKSKVNKSKVNKSKVNKSKKMNKLFDAAIRQRFERILHRKGGILLNYNDIVTT